MEGKDKATGKTTRAAKRKPKPKAKPTKPSKPKSYIFPDTDIEVPTNLPKVIKGRRLADSSKIKIAKYVCEVYALDQYTLDDVLNHFGIKSHTTFHKWIKEIDEINELYQDAIQQKDKSYFNRIRSKARTSLEKSVEGYTVTTTQVKRTPVHTKQKDGSVVIDNDTFIEEKTIKQVYVKPMPTLIQYVLDNHDPDNFTRNPDAKRDGGPKGEFDDWNDDQIEAELERLEKDGY